MLRDGLTTNLNFTKYLQELSTEELDDLTTKLNSCGYSGSKNIEELINLLSQSKSNARITIEQCQIDDVKMNDCLFQSR